MLSLRVLTFAMFGLLMLGCGPRWAIVAQANPDPLVGAQTFYVEPVHFDPPFVGGKLETEYLAGKSPDQRDSWNVDKSETSSRYASSLISALGEPPAIRFIVQPAPGVFIVRPIIQFIEPGFYAGLVAAPTEVHMRVQILSSEGGIIDEIAIRSVIGSSLIYPSSGGRMRAAGEDLAQVTAEYIRKRVQGR